MVEGTESCWLNVWQIIPLSHSFNSFSAHLLGVLSELSIVYAMGTHKVILFPPSRSGSCGWTESPVVMWPDCQGSNPFALLSSSSSNPFSLLSSWASYWSSPCLSSLHCKMRLIIYPPKLPKLPNYLRLLWGLNESLYAGFLTRLSTQCYVSLHCPIWQPLHWLREATVLHMRLVQAETCCKYKIQT